ncbi:hypothetical protein WR25_03399 [Diploscapter pachys]|uniref:Uncharacterized protein n=1 Tax=Diploscapter pachys TaxID=2018661 RepID=A0A2A2LTG6_9BILA|nr:hypothetical protein WR25_03399 [Diploscapter pachys]
MHTHIRVVCNIFYGSFVSLISILVIDTLLLSVESRTIEKRFEHTVRDAEYCNEVRNSKGALYTPQFVNQDELELALMDSDYVPSKEKKDLVLYLANLSKPDLLCNSTLFTPDINKKIDKNCDEICSLCVPGSVPLCTIRSKRIFIFGATCYCTYASEDDPIKQAAFSIRNEGLLIHQPVVKLPTN